MASLVKVRTPSRGQGRPARGSSGESDEDSGRMRRGDGRSEAAGSGEGGAHADRGVFALGDMLKTKVAEVEASHLAPLPAPPNLVLPSSAPYDLQPSERLSPSHSPVPYASSQVLSGVAPMSGMSIMEGPTSLENLMRDRYVF